MVICLYFSGSSTGSGSVPHSFSVEEIQKGRLLLKSSKSYPDDFLKKKKEGGCPVDPDGDNSSSGVSSDQEVPMGNPNELVSERLGPSEKSIGSQARPQSGKVVSYILIRLL